MTELTVSVCIELEDAAGDEGYHGRTSEPPCGGNACHEAGYYQQYRADNIEDDG